MDYSRLPKIELHLHLDCSLSYEVVQQIDPGISYAAYCENFIAPAKCTDLADYISRAVNAITLMQTKAHLEMVVADLFNQLKNDNVIYAEIRFAPLQHLQNGLTPHEVVSIVNDATVAAIKQTGVLAGIILCTLRHYTELQSMQTVQLVHAFKGTCVAGFDIAADEAGFPIDNHVKAFAFAKQKQLMCTAHAGEARGADSVWQTLHSFHPQRIGHGVRSAEDEMLLVYLKRNNIHLEICPTSNVQTNVFENIQQHTADYIYNKGVSISINTDARTISNVNLADEYATMEKYFQWTMQHFYNCNMQAIEHAFTTNEVKALLKKQIAEAYLPSALK